MANKKKIAAKSKTKSSKYAKLMAAASKELADKKKELVKAEKALAKAQKSHTELLSEVARLDMLERSLKALINGTEPPQNVRYIYTYPQWVWYQQPYVTYTVPPYNQPNYLGYWLNGQWQSSPQTISTTCQNSDMTMSNATSNAVLTSVTTNSGTNFTANGATVPSANNIGLTNGSAAAPTSTMTAWQAGTLSIEPSGITIDLTTHAEQEEAPGPEPAEAEAAKA